MNGDAERGLTRITPVTRLTRRRVAAAAAAAAGSGALASCGAGAGAGQAAPPAEVTGRLVLWSTYGTYNWTDDVTGQLVREFREKNPKLDVATEVASGNAAEKLLTSVAAGTPPDVTQSAPEQASELGGTGILRALDSYFKASRSLKLADLWPGYTRDAVWKGQTYGVPFSAAITTFYSQQEALRGAGIDPAKPAQTWDELEQHVRRLYKEASPGMPAALGWPAFSGNGSASTWVVPYYQLGGDVVSADRTKATLNNAIAIRTIEWLQAIFKAQGGLDAVNKFVSANGGGTGAFATGLAGYLFEGNDVPRRDVWAKAQGLKLGYTSYPLPAGGKKVSWGGCHSFLITAGAKGPDAAWRFIEYMSTDAVHLRFAERYDRIPARISASKSDAYVKGDPLKKLAIEDMAVRRGPVTGPGTADIQKLGNDMVTNVVLGKVSVRDGLTETEKQIQLILDRWK